MSYAKGNAPRDIVYATGGGTTLDKMRDFVKEPNEFTPVEKVNNPGDVPQAYKKDAPTPVTKGKSASNVVGVPAPKAPKKSSGL